MKLKHFLLLHALIATLFGLALVLVPELLYELYGQRIATRHAATARLWGTALLGIALVVWSMRTAPPSPLRRRLLRAMLIYMSVGTLVAVITHLLIRAPLIAWSTPLIFFLLAVGYAAFLRREPRFKQQET